VRPMFGKIPATTLFTLALFSAIAVAQRSASAPETMSFWQARRAIRAASMYARSCGQVDPISVQVTLNDVQFDSVSSKGKRTHVTIATKDAGQISAHCPEDSREDSCWLTSGGKMYQVTSDRHCIVSFGAPHSKNGDSLCQLAQNVHDCLHAAGWFAAGLNSLHALAASQINLNDFHERAAAWRALPNKPALSNDLRVLRLAAEDAVKNNKPTEALNYYELGVQQDPTWAQGWFNAAVIAGQLGYYADAAEHMQNYLELDPGAQDAQSAREQIDLWRFKAKENSATPAQNSQTK
jgi:hypothetical protein